MRMCVIAMILLVVLCLGAASAKKKKVKKRELSVSQSRYDRDMHGKNGYLTSHKFGYKQQRADIKIL